MIPPTPQRLRAGLTLIELLAVIAIVAILAAIVFSITRSTIADTRRAQGTANLRSLYAISQTYASEYNGRIIPNRFQNPASGNEPAFTQNWRQMLIDQDYIAAPERLEQNAAALGHPGLVDKYSERFGRATFAMNVRIGYRGAPQTHHGPVAFQQAEHPQRTLFMTSGVYFPGPSNYSEVIWPGGSVSAGTASEPDSGGQVLLLFLDGHVEARPAELIPVGEGFQTTDRLFWRGTYTSLH